MMPVREIRDKYFELIKAYIGSNDEKYLAGVAELGKELVELDIMLEDIAEIHEEALLRLPGDDLNKELIETARSISSPLMELLMAYGLTFRKQNEQLDNYSKHLEELVEERTAELEAAVGELDSFNYSVSHDLRVPLRAIDGFSNILSEEYQGKLDEEGRRLLGVIRDSTMRMGQLIDDLLRLSRLGRAEMKIVDIDMEGVARGVIDELKAGGDGSEIEFRVVKIPHLRGDATLVRQVFSNLISKAVKFTAPMDMAVVEVGCESKDSEDVYFVRDNGVGFDMKYVDKMFELFQRLHGEEEFKGTGIGLALVKKIVNRHGGRVWAEGEVGKGATFYFTIRGEEGVNGGT